MPIAVSDTCDVNCPSSGMVTFAKIDENNILLELRFCGHHGNENYVELIRKEWKVVSDNRTFCIENPRGKGEALSSERDVQASPVDPEREDGDSGTGPVAARS